MVPEPMGRAPALGAEADANAGTEAAGTGAAAGTGVGKVLREAADGIRLRHPGVDVGVEQLTGRASDELVKAAPEAELLVLGSRGLSGIAGFLLGLSLILPIGAQNAFVLRIGLRGEHVLAVCLTCALSDAVLILAGVSGFAQISAWLPWVETILLYGGVAFLLAYGARSFTAAFGSASLRPSEAAAKSLGRVVLTCLALTWLNPHVYLDTVFLLGSIAADRGELRWTFGLGAAVASLCWFAALGFGARLLSPYLARPVAWRILDGLVAATMLVLGVTLIAGS